MTALLTDFYQLTMAYGYWQSGIHNQDSVFHLFFRRNPLRAEYVVTSGLQSVVEFIQQFHFSDDDIAYLASLKNPVFSNEFLAYLKTLRFTGDIDAMPEGSIVFSNEPILRVRAPLLLCQLLETPLINAINFSSAVSSLASRMRTIAGEDDLFEFGLRRAQGPDGGLTASKAAFLGGFDATSNILAGKKFGIPVMGTMAHSWVMAFEDEYSAFEAYARFFPDNIVLLVDTYNTLQGIDNAIAIAKKGYDLKGIRLDSGDLNALSVIARQKLDAAGLLNTKIVASGDITETRLAELKSQKAPINAWGIGTHLSTSYEQPALDMVYKLGAIQKAGGWQYKLKVSDNRRKTSDPGILQVRRFYDDAGRWLRDVIYHESLGIPESGKSADLLIPLFRKGELKYDLPTAHQVREYGLSQVKAYQFSVKQSESYSVTREEKLLALKNKLM